MIRHAEEKDLPEILRIYDYAKNFMRENGNSVQWINGYPSRELLLSDIENANLYVYEQASFIHAVFAFIIGEDETYNYIEDGSWISDTPYGTIHRIASDGTVKGIFEKACEFCFEKIGHLRVDTHECNKIMQHVVLKSGFTRCGIIYIKDGTPRIAFENIK